MITLGHPPRGMGYEGVNCSRNDQMHLKPGWVDERNCYGLVNLIGLLERALIGFKSPSNPSVGPSPQLHMLYLRYGLLTDSAGWTKSLTITIKFHCLLPLPTQVRRSLRSSKDMYHRQLRFIRSTVCKHLTYTGDTKIDKNSGQPEYCISSSHPVDWRSGNGETYTCHRFYGQPERMVISEVSIQMLFLSDQTFRGPQVAGKCSLCPR